MTSYFEKMGFLRKKGGNDFGHTTKAEIAIGINYGGESVEERE